MQQKQDTEFEKRKKSQTTQNEKQKKVFWRRSARGIFFCIIVACVFYKLLDIKNWEQSALMFIGLPAVLAIGLSFVPTKSTTGLMLKGTSIFLLVSGIFLGEGLICILMAAPLFYAIAVFFGKIIDRLKNRNKNKGRMAVFLLILPFAFEGAHPRFSFPRHEEVTVRKTVLIQEAPEDILSRRLLFTTKPPLFLQLGFPVPLYVTGGGLEPGSRGCIRYKKSKKSGDTCFRITAKEDNKIFFGDLEDKSPLAHWLKWKEFAVQWEKGDSGTTEIQMTLVYDRLLDPSWYFGPFERYAVRLAGEWFLNSYFEKPPDKKL